jgi:hypothetical protein
MSKTVTIPFLQSYLYHHYQFDFKQNKEPVKYNTLCYYLRTHMKTVYGLVKRVGFFSPSDEKILPLKLRFFKQYADAHVRVSQGKAVFVWMDESYCHHNYSHDRSIFLSGSAEGNRVKGAASKGKRFVIVAAMTADGMYLNTLLPLCSL